jgi:hypothetical protein
MPNLKPFRDYDESNVINLFTFTGVSLTTTVSKGTFVTAIGSGVNLRDESLVNNLSIYGNSVSALFTPPWSLVAAPSGSFKNTVIGATLKDFRNQDENGENLLFHPRKAAEMDVIISGQAMPVITKGLFLYSGITTGNANGVIAFGTGFAVSDAGDGSIKTAPYYVTASGVGTAATTAINPTVLGKFLGPINTDGYALIKIEL